QADPDHRYVAHPNAVEAMAPGSVLDDCGALCVALLLYHLPKHLQPIAVEAGKKRDLSQRLSGISLDSHRFLQRLTARHYDTAPRGPARESGPSPADGGGSDDLASGLGRRRGAASSA